MPDFDDFKALLDRQSEVGKIDRAEQKAVREQVALHVRYVTQSESWDIFLRHIQAMLDADTRDRDTLKEKILSPDTTAPEEIATLRHRLMWVSGKVEAFEQLLQLPKDLMAAGEEKS